MNDGGPRAAITALWFQSPSAESVGVSPCSPIAGTSVKQTCIFITRTINE